MARNEYYHLALIDRRQRLPVLLGLGAWLAACLAGLLAVQPASAGVDAAGVLTVTTFSDEFGANAGQCALREAIQAVSTTAAFGGCAGGGSGTVIQLPAGSYALTLAGADEDGNASGDLDLWVTMTLQAVGGPAVINAAGLGDRVLDAHAGAIELQDLTLTGGNVTTTSFAVGGGLLNTGAITLTRTDVVGNLANYGGGIFNDSSGNGGKGLWLVNSQIADNHAVLYGGGIYNASLAALDLRLSSIFSNTAGQIGGGLFNANNVSVPAEAVVLRNVTLSGNAVDQANGDGGALYNTGVLLLNNVTIAGNHAYRGGGLSNAGSVRVSNSLIGTNTSATNTADCFGPLHSLGYNLLSDWAGCNVTGVTATVLSGVNPGLDILAPNGGRTLTRALLQGSPSVDQGNPAAPTGAGATCETVDQRGWSRQGLCDLGAYDLGSPWRVWLTTVLR